MTSRSNEGSSYGPRPPDFIGFLYERGQVDVATLHNVRRRADARRTPLGRLLLKHRAISVRGIMQVLQIQGVQRQRRFGEIAIDEGFISSGQLERALREQEQERSFQVELIREDQLLDRETLERAVADYADHVERCASASATDVAPALQSA